MRKSDLELASVVAVRYLRRLIDSEDALTKDRLAAAFDVLDRVHGKPSAQAARLDDVPIVRIVDDIPQF